jgi:hypothetical protein
MVERRIPPILGTSLRADGNFGGHLSNSLRMFLECGLEFPERLLPIVGVLGCRFGAKFPNPIFQPLVHGLGSNITGR